MATRAIYTFDDGYTQRHIYIHYDGYPSGAANYFEKWVGSGKSWPVPRFEADEAAAGFVAAVKDDPGNVRISDSRTRHCDVEFGYTVRLEGKALFIKVVSTNYWGGELNETPIYDGPLYEFIANAESVERRHYEAA